MSDGAEALHYIAVANAIKASGAIVRLPEEDFRLILTKQDKPVVVFTKGSFLTGGHKYLTPYKGLIFYTVTKEPLDLPGSAEVITSKKMWLPS